MDQKTYLIVDFIEDRAITTCSDGRTVEIEFENIPEDSKKGDTLLHTEGTYVKQK